MHDIAPNLGNIVNRWLYSSNDLIIVLLFYLSSLLLFNYLLHKLYYRPAKGGHCVPANLQDLQENQ